MIHKPTPEGILVDKIKALVPMGYHHVVPWLSVYGVCVEAFQAERESQEKRMAALEAVAKDAIAHVRTLKGKDVTLELSRLIYHIDRLPKDILRTSSTKGPQQEPSRHYEKSEVRACLDSLMRAAVAQQEMSLANCIKEWADKLGIELGSSERPKKPKPPPIRIIRECDSKPRENQGQ